MNVRVDAACGDNASLGSDHFGCRSHGHGMPFPGCGIGPGRAESALDAGISGVADAHDSAVLDSDVGLDDPQDGIEDQRVGDDEVERLGIEGGRGLAHAVADHLAAAELDLVSVAAALGDEVAFNLDEQVGIGEPDPIAHGRAEHFGVLTAFEVQAHFNFGLRSADCGLGARFSAVCSRGPLMRPLRPKTSR